jgi:hypothetical protein
MRNTGEIVCCPMNPFLRFFSNKNTTFTFRPRQNFAWDTLGQIYSGQQFTENIYSGKVANLF